MEVSPAAVESNARNLSRNLAEGSSLMAVVKADGYGHGAVTVAKAALRGFACGLGVATLPEGIQLRKAGIRAPILVMGNLSQVDELRSCLHWELMPTISTKREVFLCNQLANGTGRNFPVQVKFDTGMSRLGCELGEVPDLVSEIVNSSYLNLKGAYSHLAMADGSFPGKAASVTQQQQEKFQDVIRTLPHQPDRLCVHLANSAGTLRDPKFHYDMVRVGLALYGHNPIQTGCGIGLVPALAVKAKVTLIREVPQGVGVSYGHLFITSRFSRLAVVGIGYADGISRSLSGRIFALFQNRRIPQVGAITMDQLVLDVTDHQNVEVGSVVTLLGKDGDEIITPQDWCNVSDLIPWEVLCGFKHRLPRLVA